MLDHTPGCAQIKLGVTEWNIDAGSWGLGRAKQATLEAALMNARYLHLLMRHSDRVEIACRSNLANSYCGAIIETAAFRLGRAQTRQLLCHALVFASCQARPVAARSHPATAWTSSPAVPKTGNPVVLFAVNPRPEPVELSARFDGFGGAIRPARAEALCDPLNAGQRDVMNHWNAPERISIVPLTSVSDKLVLPALSATAIEFQGAP